MSVKIDIIYKILNKFIAHIGQFYDKTHIMFSNHQVALIYATQTI